MINWYLVYSSPEFTTIVYSTYACYRKDFYSSIDVSNKYRFKHQLVLSSLRLVTLHDVRSKSLYKADISSTENRQTQTRQSQEKVSKEIRKYGN